MAVDGGLVAKIEDGKANIAGGALAARIDSKSGNILDELQIDGKAVFTPGKAARLVLDCVRSSSEFLPVNQFVCRDPNATFDHRKVQLKALETETAGHI